jgi:hypothetical protein
MTDTLTQDTQHKVVTENKAVTDRDDRGRFLTGNTGGGRPKGSRNKLATEFIDAMHAEFQISGPAAIKKLAEKDPGKWLTLIANICPKELEMAVKLDFDMSREAGDFARAFRLAREHIGADNPPMLIDITPEEESVDD